MPRHRISCRCRSSSQLRSEPFGLLTGFRLGASGFGLGSGLGLNLRRRGCRQRLADRRVVPDLRPGLRLEIGQAVTAQPRVLHHARPDPQRIQPDPAPGIRRDPLLTGRRAPVANQLHVPCFFVFFQPTLTDCAERDTPGSSHSSNGFARSADHPRYDGAPLQPLHISHSCPAPVEPARAISHSCHIAGARTGMHDELINCMKGVQALRFV